jgi:hypothetical protein
VNVPVTVAGRRSVDRRQLESWLLRPTGVLLTDRARAQRFVLATLRDMYATDFEVEAWLAEPRAEFGGASANDLLLTQRAGEVESLAVQHWNEQ